MKLSPPDYVLSVSPYSPGKPIEETEREYGINNAVKLASNENPLGPSPRALDVLQAAAVKLHRYPDGGGYYLLEKLAAHLKVSPANLVLGNGSDDIIAMLTRALLMPGDEVIMTRPAFAMYEIGVRLANARPVMVPLQSLAINLTAVGEAVTPATRMIFLTNPHNPTGTVFSADDFNRFLQNLSPSVVVVVDEAYIEFVQDDQTADMHAFLEDDRPLVALRTFSKAYGLAGLRIGYGIMPPALTDLLHRVRQPFNVNSLAQAAALAALDDTDFLNRTRQAVQAGLKYLYAELDRLQIPYFPTQANFFLIDVKKPADSVFEDLLRQGVIVRSMTSYGYPTYIRVTVGQRRENERFIEALTKVLS